MKFTSTSSRFHRTILGALSLGLCSCAPIMSVPPATPIPQDASSQIGVGALAAASHSRVTAAALWQRFPLEGDGKEAGYVVSVSDPGAFAVGGTYRFPVISGDGPVKMSTQLEAGANWVGTALPVFVPITDRLSLTTSVSGRVGAGPFPWDGGETHFYLTVPVGMSFQGRRVGLHLNGGLFNYSTRSKRESMDGGVSGEKIVFEVEEVDFFVSGNLSFALGTKDGKVK